jgi:hypothetical protein
MTKAMRRKAARRALSATLGAVLILAAAGPARDARGEGSGRFRGVPTQFIAALGDPAARSGSDAQAWGVWRADPGPRGVQLSRYEDLKAAGGVAPTRWRFDTADWWLEEHGLLMEPPEFPLPPGRYVVTGGREVTTVLTIHESEPDGTRRWELANGATLEDVTHLACRSARYTPSGSESRCTPDQAARDAFPVAAGATMPAIEGCAKRDYAVLFLIGVADGD